MVDIPNTFIPGEVASATEVNENFNALKDGINQNSSYISNIENDVSNLQLNKADKNGNKNELFNVADGVVDSNAVSMKQLRERTQTTLNYIDGLVIKIDTNNTDLVISGGQCYDTNREYILSSGETVFTPTSLSVDTEYNVMICGTVVDDVVTEVGFEAHTGTSPSTEYDIYRIIGTFKTAPNSTQIDSVVTYSGSATAEVNTMTIIGDSILTTTKNTNFNFANTGSTYNIPNDGHSYIAWVRNRDTNNSGTIQIRGNSNTITLMNIKIGANSVTTIPIPATNNRYIYCNRSLDIRAWVRV